LNSLQKTKNYRARDIARVAKFRVDGKIYAASTTEFELMLSTAWADFGNSKVISTW
jgi:hypothetical protein